MYFSVLYTFVFVTRRAYMLLWDSTSISTTGDSANQVSRRMWRR